MDGFLSFKSDTFFFPNWYNEFQRQRKREISFRGRERERKKISEFWFVSYFFPLTLSKVNKNSILLTLMNFISVFFCVKEWACSFYNFSGAVDCIDSYSIYQPYYYYYYYVVLTVLCVCYQNWLNFCYDSFQL